MSLNKFLAIRDFPDGRPSIDRRILGFLIDVILVSIPLVVLGFRIGLTGLQTYLVLVGMAAILVLALYAPTLMALTGATFGQRILKMHVVDSATGKYPTFRQALLKCFAALPLRFFVYPEYELFKKEGDQKVDPWWDRFAKVITLLR